MTKKVAVLKKGLIGKGSFKNESPYFHTSNEIFKFNNTIIVNLLKSFPYNMDVILY